VIHSEHFWHTLQALLQLHQGSLEFCYPNAPFSPMFCMGAKVFVLEIFIAIYLYSPKGPIVHSFILSQLLQSLKYNSSGQQIRWKP